MSLQTAVSANPRFAPPFPAFDTPDKIAPISNAHLAPAGPVLHFSCDSEIYAEGNSVRSFYKVVSGVVRTCRFLNDGRRQIEAFHVAGEMFGLEVAPERRLSAEAVAD